MSSKQRKQKKQHKSKQGNDNDDYESNLDSLIVRGCKTSYDPRCFDISEQSNKPVLSAHDDGQGSLFRNCAMAINGETFIAPPTQISKPRADPYQDTINNQYNNNMNSSQQEQFNQPQQYNQFNQQISNQQLNMQQTQQINSAQKETFIKPPKSIQEQSQQNNQFNDF